MTRLSQALAHLQQAYDRHQAFLLIILLFVSFRALALILLRPGGFIYDFSDYDYYQAVGEFIPRGYLPNVNLVLAYPPLFPAILPGIFELASRVPPWVDPRLFFHLSLGAFLLLFEAGNLTLIYLIARRLDPAHTLPSDHGRQLSIPQPLRSAMIYALLFVPAYTLLGWFEALPLFFMLLALYLLLRGKISAWAWGGSAVAAALGFLAKLTPALMLPMAVPWLGTPSGKQGDPRGWLDGRSPRGLRRPLAYAAVFVAGVLAIGYPLVRSNPALATSSLRLMAIRPPWQTIWALLDGYFSFGVIPIDGRNLAGLAERGWQSSLPWPLITLLFAAGFLWLYTRRYDWRSPRTLIAFTGISVIGLFLWNKGWSPQFLVWILAFIALLLPNLTGVGIAIALSIVNVIESNIYIVMLPDERWILWATVISRSILLLTLGVQLLGQIWPHEVIARRMRRGSVWATWALIVLLGIGSVMAIPRATQAYGERRLAEDPYRGVIGFLQAEAEWPGGGIATEELDAWRSLYPWLRQDYDFVVLDDYSPDGDPAGLAARRLDALADSVGGEFWWLQRAAGTDGTSGESGLAGEFFQRPDVREIESRTLADYRLSRILRLPTRPEATLAVAGGPIILWTHNLDAPRRGDDLHLVLYWAAESPVEKQYTVFTQLFDPSGRMVAQQDNPPVSGSAPTDVWNPGAIIRDTYRLSVPAEAEPGDYRLLVGLYDAQGQRAPLTVNGSTRDHLELTLYVH